MVFFIITVFSKVFLLLVCVQKSFYYKCMFKSIYDYEFLLMIMLLLKAIAHR